MFVLIGKCKLSFRLDGHAFVVTSYNSYFYNQARLPNVIIVKTGFANFFLMRFIWNVVYFIWLTPDVWTSLTLILPQLALLWVVVYLTIIHFNFVNSLHFISLLEYLIKTDLDDSKQFSWLFIFNNRLRGFTVVKNILSKPSLKAKYAAFGLCFRLIINYRCEPSFSIFLKLKFIRFSLRFCKKVSNKL